MSNPYIEYYRNQAGSGLAGYSGYKFQRGHGFFGNIFQHILKPLGQYFGKQALSTGIGIGSDILGGENLKESAKKRLKMTGENVLNDAVKRATKFAQTGKGRKRRRRRKKSKKINKIKSKPRKIIKKKRKRRKRSLKKKKSKKSRLSHLF